MHSNGQLKRGVSSAKVKATLTCSKAQNMGSASLKVPGLTARLKADSGWLPAMKKESHGSQPQPLKPQARPWTDSRSKAHTVPVDSLAQQGGLG